MNICGSNLVSDIDFVDFHVFQILGVSGGAGVDFEVKKQIGEFVSRKIRSLPIPIIEYEEFNCVFDFEN